MRYLGKLKSGDHTVCYSSYENETENNGVSFIISNEKRATPLDNLKFFSARFRYSSLNRFVIQTCAPTIDSIYLKSNNFYDDLQYVCHHPNSIDAKTVLVDFNTEVGAEHRVAILRWLSKNPCWILGRKRSRYWQNSVSTTVETRLNLERTGHTNWNFNDFILHQSEIQAYRLRLQKRIQLQTAAMTTYRLLLWYR